MKKLCITSIILSILMITNCIQAQEFITPMRGAGTCWKFVKDAHGLEIVEFYPAANADGWFTVSQISRATAGSKLGHNGYIKIANAYNPQAAFYLGSTFPTRSLIFGKGAKMACFKCVPDITNCLPNDPIRGKECFTGAQAIQCNQQINCSEVIEITECYSKGEGAFSFGYNDLKLSSLDMNQLINLSGAGTGAEQAKPDATSQRGSVVAASLGVPNVQ